MESHPLSASIEDLQQIADSARALWDITQNTKATLINVSENATFRIEDRGRPRAILRVHRQNYHSKRAIECELAWMDALAKQTSLKIPKHFKGRNGDAVQTLHIDGNKAPRHLVLFEFFEGDEPNATSNLTGFFEHLGSIAAQTHIHAQQWSLPQDFERLTWDEGAIFGPDPIWGLWRNAPGVTASINSVLKKTERLITNRLMAYGKSSDRFGLIHGDMRLANLLVGKDQTCLIDFDDCGFGWFMYDFAAAISFIEDSPQIPHLKTAWLKGYRSLKHLSAEDAAELDTFVMLRRMALLAWIGSHIDAPEPQALASEFAINTGKLAQNYLANFT